MTRIRSSGTWGSALSSAEFAAIRSAGFEPVGQVLGAAVYSSGTAGGYTCPGSFGPQVRAMYEARRAAVDRIAAECAQLGGHGVVGVRLSCGDFLLGGLEFTAIGTAVRAPGVAYGHLAPFTSDLSGQDFAKLIMTGWVPVGLVLGFSIGSRHDDRTTTRQARWMSGNAEVAGWTELVNRARHDARRQLEADVAGLAAEGVVIATMRMRVRERDCPAAVGRRDHIVEATLIGTAIAGFAEAARAGQRPREAGPALAVMSLDPQRRQAARART
jgi:uncharacterized protein YbjQ (UPF0145 family)